MSESPKPEQQQAPEPMSPVESAPADAPVPAATQAPEPMPQRRFPDILAELYAFVASWFRRNKWVGWAAILFAVVPDWQSRFAFWADQLQKVGGSTAILSGALRYFPDVLWTFGGCYIVVMVVLEGYNRARHWMPLAGWTVFLVCLICFATLALFISFIENSRIPEALEYFESQTAERTVTKEQADSFKIKLKESKDQIPPFPLLAGRDAEILQYAAEILDTFKGAGLKIVSDGKEQTLPVPTDLYAMNWRGVLICVQFFDAPPRSAVLLKNAIEAAGMTAHYITVRNAPPDTLFVIVGRK